MFWSEKTRVAADVLLAALVAVNLWLGFLIYGVRDLIYLNRSIMGDLQTKTDVIISRPCKP